MTQQPTFSIEQLLLYKVLPCPEGELCPCCPREVVTKNQYADSEYACPFYHHDRDRRRVVVNDQGGAEFVYQANYYDGRARESVDRYAKNYFESMWHPLYYKLFQCKRVYCEGSFWCPFFHNHTEKESWNEIFERSLGREKAEFVKDKSKPGKENFQTRDSPNKQDMMEDEFREEKREESEIGAYFKFQVGMTCREESRKKCESKGSSLGSLSRKGSDDSNESNIEMMYNPFGKYEDYLKEDIQAIIQMIMSH